AAAGKPVSASATMNSNPNPIKDFLFIINFLLSTKLSTSSQTYKINYTFVPLLPQNLERRLEKFAILFPNSVWEQDGR
ncbi:MAG TPA: hypothetical protein VEC96_00540, partial [Anaerolineae bacterium]|nr:hypothetical protein [Anaerolineae bacterium]